jgi:hypothetical protein
LIIEKDAFDNVIKLFIDKHIDNIDLAVLGFVKGFNKRKNYAIMSDYPSEIF